MYKDFWRIFVATVLRDMRTRFGRTYVSFLISIAWPLTHLSIICSVYYLSNKIVPIGDDLGVFVTTGVAPYIFCLYPARFTANAVVQNKALLQFAIIKPLHLVMARAVLEIFSASIVFAIFSSTLFAMGVAIVPFDIHRAFSALAATIFLGIGIGFFGVSLSALNAIVGALTTAFSIVGMYLASGAFLPPSLMTPAVRDMMFYNPLYHSVGILRSTYFDGFEGDDCRVSYILLIGCVYFFLGLAGERLIRGRIMI